MNHDMMMEPSGTFIGHLIPGLVFMSLAIWWIVDLFLKGIRKQGDPIERSIFVPIIKIIALPIGGFIELPNSGWYPMDWVMGWHHITVYMAFALSGIVDLLARKELLTTRATHFGFAGATIIGGLLFYGHGTGPGVEGVCHTIIMLLFFSISFLTIAESILPELKLEWFRIASMLSLGFWMVISAFLIFKSGWDFDIHIQEAHVWLRFSWMLIAVATVTTAFSVIINNRAELSKK